MKYKKTVITGGGGLLGRSVIPKLLRKGHEITVVDLNIHDVSKKIKYIKGSFSDEKLMSSLLKKTDSVFHFAAILGVDNCRLNPQQVMKVNYEDTKILIDLCLKTGIKKFIFSSSSEVYGNSPKVPYKEGHKLTPVSAYGKSKAMVEDYLASVHKNGLKVGISRLFNVYGYHQRKDFVVPIFIEACFKNMPIKIYGDGEQIRCFTYVSDAAEGIVKLFEYDDSFFEIVNIGRRQEYKIKDLAEIIIRKMPNSKSRIKYLAHGSKNVRHVSLEIRRRVPHIEKAKKLLNFVASTSLEDGIDKIVKEIELKKVF